MTYSPLFAEKVCGTCGRYRGEHIPLGDMRLNSNMQCPTTFTPVNDD